MKWEKIKKYPYYMPKDCMDNRYQLFKDFINYFKFDRISNETAVGDMNKFLNGLRTYNNTSSYWSGLSYDEVPNRDHASVFKKQGTRQIVFVHHPYEYNLQKLKDWCNERDLVYVVMEQDDSFYYPGHSYMILIMSRNTYTEFSELYGFPITFYANYGKGLEVD